MTWPQPTHLPSRRPIYLPHKTMSDPAFPPIPPAPPPQVLSHRWFSEQAAAIDLPEPTVLLRMRQFARYSVFKKTALRVLAGGLPADEVEGLQRMFMAIDGDENGEITPGELRRAVKRTEGNVKGESEVRRA
eukprot:361193-Chlamydomonas_euryale.AAC.1